jgi:hypothetical protein
MPPHPLDIAAARNEVRENVGTVIAIVHQLAVHADPVA